MSVNANQASVINYILNNLKRYSRGRDNSIYEDASETLTPQLLERNNARTIMCPKMNKKIREISLNATKIIKGPSDDFSKTQIYSIDPKTLKITIETQRLCGNPACSFAHNETQKRDKKSCWNYYYYGFCNEMHNSNHISQFSHDYIKSKGHELPSVFIKQMVDSNNRFTIFFHSHFINVFIRESNETLKVSHDFVKNMFIESKSNPSSGFELKMKLIFDYISWLYDTTLSNSTKEDNARSFFLHSLTNICIQINNYTNNSILTTENLIQLGITIQHYGEMIHNKLNTLFSFKTSLSGKLTGMILEMKVDDISICINDEKQFYNQVINGITILEQDSQLNTKYNLDLSSLKQTIESKLNQLTNENGKIIFTKLNNLSSFTSELPGKLTGMFLEMDSNDISICINNETEFYTKIIEAILILEQALNGDETLIPFKVDLSSLKQVVYPKVSTNSSPSKIIVEDKLNKQSYSNIVTKPKQSIPLDITIDDSLPKTAYDTYKPESIDVL
jgi:hypothetical protein